MRNKNKISTTLTIYGGRMFAVAVLLAFAAVGTAYADTITKTFEFGPGTQYSRSNVRTFPVPCGKPVTVTVKFRTSAPASLVAKAIYEVPIRIELREPDTAPGQEGPLVVVKNTTAGTTEQTVTLSGAFKDRGCSLPWRVRVEHANAGPAPFVTTGSIKVDFDSAVRNNLVNGGFNVLGGSEETVNLGSTGGLEEGTIVLKGDWVHSVGIEGPIAIKLRFTLIDPSGTEVKTAEGYADRQMERDEGYTILKLIYQVTKCTPGQWKLRIRNLHVGLLPPKAYIKTIDSTYTPACP